MPALLLTSGTRLWLLTSYLALLALSTTAAAERTGAVIYHEMCASCHGAAGEGVVSGYANPLIGDRSIGELARYIDQTMPEGEPEKLNAADSALVAEYIHEAFYSPTAQARNKPARVELSRLTVRQYRLAVADVVESFRWSRNWPDKHGLKGEYYSSRRSTKENRKLERDDPVVRFQFGEGTPDAEKFPEKEYFIRWLGSLYAPVSGEYELVVRSENGVRLWLNDQWGKAIIDAGVKSGDDTEYRTSMFLTGGRAYPLRLEHYRAPKEPTGSVELLWKPPHQGLDTIPMRFLTPESYPQSLIVSAPFPPDDRSVGYERGTAISKAWDEATTEAALETADYILSQLNDLAKTKSDAKDRVEKLQAFCRQFAERAFRRPVDADELRLLVDAQFAQAASPELAVQRSVLLTLKSPRFLYRELGGGNDAYNVAARLSFALWDSIPDNQLLDAARRNELQTADQIRRQAQRMSRDLRAKAKLREFLHQWLKVDHLHDLAKDTELFPEFTAAVQADLRSSLDLFLDEVIDSEQADFRELLLSDALYLNGRLAKFYGADLPADAEFQKVVFEPDARAGLLSHPFVLSGFAYHRTSSPIHRGVWIARSLLGRTLRTPPVAVAPLAPDLHADLTTRERVVLQTSPAMCQSCHSLINPLGFTLENFDAVGRFRQQDQQKPVDATGTYITRAGTEVTFHGVRELAQFLAKDAETHAALTEQLFQYLVKQPILAYGPETRDTLTQEFVSRNFSLRHLQTEIAVAAALSPDGGPQVAQKSNR